MKAEEGYKVMRKAMFVINPKTLTPELKNVFVEVEREEIQKGMRPFNKSSAKIQKKRIKKAVNIVSSRFNNRGRNSRKWFSNSLTSAQYMYEWTSLGRQKQNPCSTLIHAENLGAI